VRDSTIISEFLEDRYPTPGLMPADAVGRAEVRTRLDDLEDLVDAVGELFMAKRREEPLEDAERAVDEALADWDGRLRQAPHPAGSAFSLADVHLYAHLVSLEQLRGCPLPEGLDALKAWFARTAARPAVAQATASFRG
jgi:glutathione S-transferase/RNA polymerase-associated protein